MGCICGKKSGAKKLHKLNIRTYNAKVKHGIPNGLNEIPLWEKQYESYNIKQLANECKRLQTELEGRLDRLKKVEGSLNAKKNENSEIVKQIDDSERHYAQINETSKQLLHNLRMQQNLLTERHMVHLHIDGENSPRKINSQTQEWFAKVTKQEYNPVPKHKKGKKNGDAS